ncbi:MAG: transposase [Moheibacter sp.]
MKIFIKTYLTNISDNQWITILNILEDYSLREIFSALFYLLKTGCQWRMLSREFSNWKLFG